MNSNRILNIDITLRENTLLKAKSIVLALDELGDEYAKDFAQAIGMDKSTLSQWSKVGRSSLIANLQKSLPTAFGSLYKITLLEDAYESHFGKGAGLDRIEKLVIKNRIAPTTPRSAVEDLLETQKRLTTKRKSRAREIAIEALREITPVAGNKLEDFIKNN